MNYQIKITKYDNTVINVFNVSHTVNLALLIPFAITQPPYIELIRIEVFNDKDKSESAIYIRLENLFSAIENINIFYKRNTENSNNSIPPNIQPVLNEKDNDISTKAELLAFKNDKVLNFYFKTKLKKVAFFILIAFILTNILFKISDSMKDGSALGRFNRIALIFLLLFILVTAVIIIKKIGSINKRN